ncbi:hypothetical protein FACS1894186_4610 [Alphaproteobacteria bacterium]|nr:hypothetical protein FACS1894186_4610 [Alphaproteobacteria bacterium]
MQVIKPLVASFKATVLSPAQIFREHKIPLAIAIGGGIIISVLYGWLLQGLFASIGSRMGPGGALVAGTLSRLLYGLLLSLLWTQLMVSLMRAGGGAGRAGNLMGTSISFYLTNLCLSLLVFLLVIIGAVVLSQSGGLALILSPIFACAMLFITVRLAFWPVSRAFDDKLAPRQAWALTQGNFWALFGMYLLFGLGAGIGMGILGWAFGFLPDWLNAPLTAVASLLFVAWSAHLLGAVYKELSGRQRQEAKAK